MVACNLCKKYVKSFAKILFDIYERVYAHHISVWGGLKNDFECGCEDKLDQHDKPAFLKIQTSKLLFTEEFYYYHNHVREIENKRAKIKIFDKTYIFSCVG